MRNSQIEQEETVQAKTAKALIVKYLYFRLLSKNFRKLALYRLNSLNADIQLIVNGAWASNLQLPARLCRFACEERLPFITNHHIRHSK